MVHHNRKANIIQSFGRYTDVTSYEDNIEDKPIRIGQLPEKIEDLYKLEDSYDSLVPNQRAAHEAKSKYLKSDISGGQTAATSGGN